MKRLSLFLILLSGFFLRVHLLGRENFWLDEAYSWGWVVNTTWLNIWTALQEFSDVTPLFYVVNKLFLPFFGASEFGFRLPSVFIGWLALALIYRLGRAMFGQWQAIIAMMIVALSPFAVWHARDARPYAMYLLFGTLTLWGFWKAERGKSWILFVVSSMAGYLTHYLSALFAYAQAAYIFSRFRIQPTLFRQWFLAQVIAGIPTAIWAGSFYLSRHYVSANWWIPAITIFTPFQTLWNFFSGDATTVTPALIVGAIILVTLMIIGARREWNRARESVQLLLWWILLPMSLALFFSFRQPVYADRYFEPALIAVALLIGAGVTALPRWGGVAASTVIAVGLVFSSFRIYNDPIFVKQQWREVAKIVDERNLPVALSDPQGIVVITPYITRPPNYVLGRDVKELDQRLSEGSFLFIVPSPVKNEMAQALSKPLPYDPLTEGADYFVNWLKDHPELKVTPYRFVGAAVVVVEK